MASAIFTFFDRLVQKGDLDVLANVVLNGEGHRLLGYKSRNPDVQNFLENVPVYMVSGKKTLNSFP